LYGAAVFHLDDMPAERGFDGAETVAFFQLEGGIAEFGHHFILGEPAEVAAIGAGAFIGRFSLAILSKSPAFFRLRFDGLGFGFGGDQNMAGLICFLAFQACDFFSIGSVQLVVV